MARKAKSDTNYVISCSHCLNTEFKLNDIDPNDTVKIYTDTPFKCQQLPSVASASKYNPGEDSYEKPMLSNKNINVV